MYVFLLVILVLDGLFLGVVVLLQSGKGGGLAAMGGGAAATEGILGGRQATTLLTRSTWTAGTLFMVLALVLSIMSSRAEQPESVLRQETTPATAPEPLLPGAADTGSAGGDLTLPGDAGTANPGATGGSAAGDSSGAGGAGDSGN